MGSRLAALLLLALAVACTRTTMQASQVDRLGGEDEVAEMDFWDALSEARAVTNHDAMRALLLSFGGDPAADYAGRLREARKRGWIGSGHKPPADETARVGWIARATCIEAHIRGGLSMRLLGPRERYAVRELNYRGWLPKMSPNQALSGMQMIALLSAVEDEKEGGPVEPREDLG